MDYPDFPPEAPSQLARHLTPEVFALLREVRTPEGWSLEDLCRSGLANPDSQVGLYAGDAASYDAFAPLLDPVLAELARDPVEAPPHELGDLGDGVVSTRVRAARNLVDFPFPPAMSEAQRRGLEEEVRGALEELPPPWAGTYHPLASMDPATRAELVDAHLLFHDDDRFMRAGGLLAHWPQGRGIFLSDDRHFLVWVGEEDHLRVIALRPGGDLAQVWARVVGGLERLGERLRWATHPRHGILASCPTNVGTGVRASVHVPLPHLARDEDGLRARAAALGLALRGTDGEHTEAAGAVYDLSVKVRVGVSAEDQLGALARGVQALRAAEAEARAAGH